MISAHKVSRLFYIRINVGIPPPPTLGRDLSNIAEQQMAYIHARYRGGTRDINHTIQHPALYPSRDKSTNQISIYFSRITNDRYLKLLSTSKYNSIIVHHIIVNCILIILLYFAHRSLLWRNLLKWYIKFYLRSSKINDKWDKVPNNYFLSFIILDK